MVVLRIIRIFVDVPMRVAHILAMIDYDERVV